MDYDNNEFYEFPSPYGVSFILIKFNIDGYKNLFKFPSPYGVSFILIRKSMTELIKGLLKFPSPYGVSFILIS